MKAVGGRLKLIYSHDDLYVWPRWATPITTNTSIARRPSQSRSRRSSTLDSSYARPAYDVTATWRPTSFNETILTGDLRRPLQEVPPLGEVANQSVISHRAAALAGDIAAHQGRSPGT